jgi:PIN domain nuclease of toxin-antitoxin system
VAVSVVLDSSAFLAYLRGEPGADLVAQALGGGARMSAVNWAEVLSKVADSGKDPDKFSKLLRDQGILGGALTIQPFEIGHARLTARMREDTRRLGLSLGDKACLALGKATGFPVLTADQVWSELGLGIEIRLIR